jgi:hypothetical protein
VFPAQLISILCNSVLLRIINTTTTTTTIIIIIIIIIIHFPYSTAV